MKNIINLLAGLLISFHVYGTQADSVSISETFSLDKERISEFKSDADFNYEITHIVGETLWAKIKRWISRVLRQLLYWGSNSSSGKVIVYALIISAIVISIFKILKISPNKLIGRNSTTIPFNVHEEDIHSIPFEEQIQLALDSKNYKLAVRLTYLNILKHLSDLEKIQWEPGKSNHEYSYELGAGNLTSNFKKLSNLFEICWYGGFDVEKSSFDSSKEYASKILTHS